MELTFLVFNTSELSLVDFSTVQETSEDTVRRSVDGTKTFISYADEPAFASSLTTSEGQYTYDQILDILKSSAWTPSVLPCSSIKA